MRLYLELVHQSRIDDEQKKFFKLSRPTNRYN
jgi:hypothetical protein